jgi:hypothetical protein
MAIQFELAKEDLALEPYTLVNQYYIIIQEITPLEDKNFFELISLRSTALPISTA